MKKEKLIIGISLAVGVAAFFGFRYFTSVKRKVVALAESEWKRFGRQYMNENGRITKTGGQETDKGFDKRIGDYWKAVGLNYDGQDTDFAWSAAFISWLFKNSGAGDKFPYNASHSYYVHEAIQSRLANKFNAPLVGYRVNEYAPKVGDLIAYGRQGNSNLYNAPPPYASHVDLVVSKGKNYIEVIGGNVSNSVTKRKIRTDNSGKIDDYRNAWFAVIKNNI